jgi:hypothetical protein
MTQSARQQVREFEAITHLVAVGARSDSPDLRNFGDHLVLISRHNSSPLHAKIFGLWTLLLEILIVFLSRFCMIFTAGHCITSFLHKLFAVQSQSLNPASLIANRLSSVIMPRSHRNKLAISANAGEPATWRPGLVILSMVGYQLLLAQVTVERG